jgi:hypothetical protein
MKIYVLMEDEQPVGVTRSKTRAESWIFSMNHDYIGPFDLEEPDLTPAHAPEEARGATPAQNLIRNLEQVEQGLTQHDKTLKKQVDQLDKALKKKFKSSLLKRGYTPGQPDESHGFVCESCGGSFISWSDSREKHQHSEFHRYFQEVKDLIEAGESNQDINTELGVSPKTIGKIRYALKRVENEGQPLHKVRDNPYEQHVGNHE